jgi:CBS domain-containing protein
MCTALDLIREKDEGLAQLPPEATVFDAANLMNDRHIGSVLVMHDQRLLGIFTERDVMRRVVAARLDPDHTTLEQVMTTPVACAAPHTTLDELRLVIRNRRIRHVPVVDDHGAVLGMVSIGDLNRAEHAVQEQTIHYLEQYMSVA